MKRLYFALLAIIAMTSFAACKKNTDNNDITVCPEPGTKTILGNWKEVQTYSSPGNLTDWKDVDGGIITFKTDSTFTATKPIFLLGASGKISAINDSVFTVKTSSLAGNYSVKFKDNNNTLEIWFMYCIEGCGVKLKRVAGTDFK